MARPERNTVDYFPHLLGEGKKMYFIENKYGNNGYATWYKILEKLGSTEYHYLNLNREDEVMFLAAKCKVSEELLLSIINDLSKMDVFHKELWDNKIVWCPQFIESIEDAYKKRNNKCITLDGLSTLLTGLGILKHSKQVLKGGINPQRREEKRREENNKDKLFFDLFWNMYPKKIAKNKCESKWNKLDLQTQELILKTLPNFINYKPFESYTHPNPETYFNQERWNDEIQTENSTSKKHYYLSSPFGRWDGLLTEDEFKAKTLTGYWTLEKIV